MRLMRSWMKCTRATLAEVLHQLQVMAGSVLPEDEVVGSAGAAPARLGFEVGVVWLDLCAVDEHFAVQHLDEHGAKAPLPDPPLHAVLCNRHRQLRLAGAAEENFGVQWRVHGEAANSTG